MPRSKLIAVFPGSFDPLTFGHTDIVRRALKIFDNVVIAVLENPSKATLFSAAERVKLITEEFSDCGSTVSVESFSGLLADFAKRKNSSVIIRGLRAVSDYDYEAQMALTNKSLADELETLFMMTSATNSYISSSLVRQIALFGGKVSHLVPEKVALALKAKFAK